MHSTSESCGSNKKVVKIRELELLIMRGVGGPQTGVTGESTIVQSEKTGDENRTAPSRFATTWRGEREAQTAEDPA